MERNSDIQYKVFEWLRFPLIVGVVFIHSFGDSFDYALLDFSHLTRLDCYNLFRVSISQVLAHVSVPTFYFISGYLFFIGLEKWNWKEYLKKLKKRSKSLLIPFLLWNTLCIFLSLFGIFRHEGMAGVLGFLADNNYGHLYWDCQVWNLDRTNLLGGGNIATSPYCVPLWFLRDLMVVCIFSPLLFFLIKRIGFSSIVMLLFLFITGCFIPIPGFSAMAFLFFSAGAFCRIYNIDTTRITYDYRIVIYIVATVLWIGCTLLNGHNTKTGDFIYPFFVIVGFMATINLATSIVKNNLIEMPVFLSKSSFFIYLSHTILVLSIVTKVAHSIFGETDPFLLTVGYLFVPIVTISICLAFYFFLNSLFPKLLSILTGNR